MPIEMIISDKELEQAGFYWRELEGVQALICAPLEKAGFANGFSTRLGGTSPMPDGALNLAGFNEDSAENILENRRRFLKLFAGGDAPWALAGCWQVHGSAVRLINNLSEAKPAEDARGDTVYCDAIVSNAPGVLAGVKLAEVATKALARMTAEYQSNPREVCVAIGPAAGACCYEVGTDVIEAFRNSFPGQNLFAETRMDHACIDLLRANRAQLISAGVNQNRINIAPLCTMCRTDLFFSYRREKTVQGKVGRLMSVIGRKNE